MSEVANLTQEDTNMVNFLNRAANAIVERSDYARRVQELEATHAALQEAHQRLMADNGHLSAALEQAARVIEDKDNVITVLQADKADLTQALAVARDDVTKLSGDIVALSDRLTSALNEVLERTEENAKLVDDNEHLQAKLTAEIRAHEKTFDELGRTTSERDRHIAIVTAIAGALNPTLPAPKPEPVEEGPAAPSFRVVEFSDPAASVA